MTNVVTGNCEHERECWRRVSASVGWREWDSNGVDCESRETAIKGHKEMTRENCMETHCLIVPLSNCPNAKLHRDPVSHCPIVQLSQCKIAMKRKEKLIISVAGTYEKASTNMDKQTN